MAGNVSITDTFDRVFTTTRTTIIPRVWDNITTDIPVIHWLNQQGQVELHAGGAALEFNIFKELISAVGARATQKVTPIHIDPATRGRYEWKHIYVPFKLAGQDLRKNKGPNAVVDLMLLAIEAAQASMTEALGGATLGIWSTTGEDDTTIVTGLPHLISGATTGTTGNISRTNSFWQNSSGTAITDFSANGLTRWRETLFTAKRGNEVPNAVITNQTQYLNFLASLTTTIRYNLPLESRVASTGSLDIGVPDVVFHGALVIEDANATADVAFFANSKFLKLRIDTETNLLLRDFVLSEDEDAISSMIVWMGNLTCTNLARQGRVTGGDAD